MKQILLMLISMLMLPSCSKDDGVTGGEPPATVKPSVPTIQCTLTYDVNGATDGIIPTAVTASIGTNVTLSNGSGLSRSGYTFAGWNTSGNGMGTDYAAGSSFSLSANTVLYAKWNIILNNNSMKVTIGNTTFTATLSSGATVTAFKALLPLTLTMNDFNSNEKVASLPRSLMTAATNPDRIHTGDIMLYGASSLVVFYETFSTSYSYTRIGQIDNPAGLKAALGRGNVTLKFELE